MVWHPHGRSASQRHGLASTWSFIAMIHSQRHCLAIVCSTFNTYSSSPTLNMVVHSHDTHSHRQRHGLASTWSFSNSHRHGLANSENTLKYFNERSSMPKTLSGNSVFNFQHLRFSFDCSESTYNSN